MAVETDVRAEWVSYPGGGVEISAYLTHPSGAGPFPGLVMVHENPGLTPHRQEVSRLLSGEGYAVITPNLFSRLGGKAPGGDDDHARHLAIGMAVRDEQVHADLMASHEYLVNLGDVDASRVGIIGFCMGGAKALYTACHTGVFKCLVDFYGPVEQSAERYGIGRSLLPYVPNLSCPIQFHSGDRDESCTPEEARALAAELKRSGKDAECYMYEGAQHGFHGDGARHHPQAAALAWDRALDFLRRHLQA